MSEALIETLPPVQRLALAYAPASVRAPWLALLALDAKLAGIVRAAKEPMLAQIRLAWWRDRLGESGSGWPGGQPILTLLSSWQGRHAGLAPLVDGWEALLAEAADGAVSDALALARAEAIAALAHVVGAGARAEDAGRMAGCWAAADVAAHLSEPGLRARAAAISTARDWNHAPLPRSMRPLIVLHGLAARGRGEGEGTGLSTLLLGVRLGMFGR